MTDRQLTLTKWTAAALIVLGVAATLLAERLEAAYRWLGEAGTYLVLAAAAVYLVARVIERRRHGPGPGRWR